MGCNCGNKNRQAKLQQQLARAKKQQIPTQNAGKVPAKQYLQQLQNNRKK